MASMYGLSLAPQPLGSRHGFLWREAVGVEPHLDRLSVETSFSSPLADCLRAAKCSYPARLGAVLGLFAARRPAHVARLVIAIVVNAIKGMLLAWCSPNMREERCERSTPFRTNLDASPAVTGVALNARIGAAGDHSHPRAPFLCLPLPAGVSVLPVFRNHISSMTWETHFGKR